MEQAKPKRRWVSILGQFLLFLVLTLLTQIGGLVWLVVRLFRKWKHLSAISSILLFIVTYSAATYAVTFVAPVFGRVALSCLSSSDDNFHVRSPIFCALNRNYVTPQMKQAVIALADHMAQAFPGTKTLALDGNFPFVDGFPLLPHLSHSDGRKLDIAFYYKDKDGVPLNGQTKSPIGYFAFEQPRPGDPLPCAGRNDVLTFRWDLNFLQALFPPLKLDEQRTKEAIHWLSTSGTEIGVEKIFVEPHLAARMGEANDAIRFQGCRAARHDDHIHIQVKG